MTMMSFKRFTQIKGLCEKIEGNGLKPYLSECLEEIALLNEDDDLVCVQCDRGIEGAHFVCACGGVVCISCHKHYATRWKYLCDDCADGKARS